MLPDDKPSWKRLALHGGTCAALVCLFLISPQGGGRWFPEVLTAHILFLVGSIPVGIVAGALAGLQILALDARWPRWLCWPAGACLGGAIFGFFTLLALSDIDLALFSWSIWTFGWLFFCWRRRSS